MKSWDSRAARDNLAFLVKEFQRLKRQKKEQFDVGQEIIAIERIEGETNALWGMWKSSSASGSRLSVPPEVWISLPPIESSDSFWITRSQRSRRRDKSLCH